MVEEEQSGERQQPAGEVDLNRSPFDLSDARSDEFSLEAEGDASVPQSAGILRLLLVLVAIVAIIGTAFYFVGQTLYAPETLKVEVLQPAQKIKIPARNEPAQGGAVQSAPNEVAAPVVKESVVAVKEFPAAMKPVPVSATAKDDAKASAVPAKDQIPKPPQVEAPQAGGFYLQSPGYLSSAGLKKIVKKIKAEGYTAEPLVTKEPHEMTRLYVGRYPKTLAKKRLAKVQKLSDGAFLVADKGNFILYAGSFVSLDMARHQADILFAGGINTKEKKLQIDLPRTRLKFGRFASRRVAAAMAAKLAARGIKGLEVVAAK